MTLKLQSKYLFTWVSLAFFTPIFSCVAKKSKEPDKISCKVSSDDQVPADELSSALKVGLAIIGKDTIKQQVTYFSGDEFEGRGTGEPGNAKAALWLVDAG